MAGPAADEQDPRPLRLAARRAAERPSLVAIRFFGLLVAVTLVVGVSLYSTGMGDAMLRARLAGDPSSPNLALSLTNEPLTGARYAALDSYFRRRASLDLGLPLRGLIVQHSTSTVPLYRLRPGRASLATTALAQVALAYDEDLAAHATIIEGTLDGPAAGRGGAVPVLLSRDAARGLQLRIGDRLAYSADGKTLIQPPLVLAGIFMPANPSSDYWTVSNMTLASRLLVTSRLDTFQRFAARTSLFLPDYFWLQRTDLKAVHLADGSGILDRLTRLRSEVSSLAPGAQILTSLDLSINGFLDQYSLLSVILLILAGPILALILYAVVVTTALVLERQAGEIVLMRSRGATRMQVFAIYALEGLALGALALLAGPLLGVPLAALIDHASGFLTFGGGLPVDLRLGAQPYLLGGLAAALGLLAGLLPALGLARRSLLAYRADQARLRTRPLWQRLFLDVALLAVALYGLVVLKRQGPVTSDSSTAAVAQDPLIAIAPLLFAVAITLLISRLLPWLAAAGLRVSAGYASPAMHIALRGVARAPRQPMRLVQLCTLTLTLGIFSATVAAVEARNEVDQQAYSAGASLRLAESIDRSIGGKGLPDIMPLADHLRLPGVRAASPALRYESLGNITNTANDGTTVNVLGIDPRTIGRVLWFRSDFADVPLKRLLAIIATPGPNAIVSDTFLQATGLRVGDTADISLINDQGISVHLAGVAHFFPTLDPRTTPFVITNLDFLQRASKGYGPNEVWMSTDSGPAVTDRIVQQARGWPRRIVDYEGAVAGSGAGQDQLKVGIYGVVSVGFLIAVALALLGFLAYAYLTLQQRLTEFAVVRALGLSSGGMRALLLYEHVLLLGAAMLGGILAGVLTTQLFLPYLPIATNTLPPFLIVTPWGAVAAFVLIMFAIFLAILSLYVVVVARLLLGQVLRLGEG